MRAVMLSLFAFALAFAQVVAQPPAPIPLAIVGPATAPPYRIVDFAASGELTGRALIWDIAPEDSSDVREMAGGKLIFVGPPGVYRIKLRAILFRDGTVSVETARHTLTITTPAAPAAPAPSPSRPVTPSQPPAQPGATSKIDPLKALGLIRFSTNNPKRPGEAAMCTATVMHPQLPDGRWEILTAAHCVAGEGQRGTLATRDNVGLDEKGRPQVYDSSSMLAVTVASMDKTCDLAWLVTDQPVADLYCAKLASANPSPGVRVWHSGWGIHKPGNREDGIVKQSEGAKGQTVFTGINVSQGDSGGGIIRTDTGEVLSAVCCTPDYAPFPGRAPYNPNRDMFGGSARNAWRLRPSAAGGVATAINPDRSEFIPARPYPAPAVGEGRFPHDLQHLPLVTGGP